MSSVLFKKTTDTDAQRLGNEDEGKDDDDQDQYGVYWPHSIRPNICLALYC